LSKERSREARIINALLGSSMEDGRKLEWKTSHMFLGFAAATIFSVALLFFNYMNLGTAFTLIAFNFLFAPLTFTLNGSLRMKIFLLFAGNVVGLLWNGLFSSFVSAVAVGRVELLSVLYLVVSPFMNLVWIVTFYSVSLTILARPEIGRARVGT